MVMKKKSLEVSRRRWGVVFILPQLISLICFGIIPIVIAFVLSFYEWNGFTIPEFIGIDNFITVLKDPDMWTAIKNTAVYTVIYVPCSIVLALLLAVVLNKVAGKLFYRAVFFLPQVVTSVGIAVVWSWIYQPQFGILNMILRFFGFEGKEWLRDPSTAMGAVIVMSIWWGLGYNIVLFLAGLQNVPAAYVEAAKIDGANSWQILKNVTIPMVMPSITICTFLTLTNGFKLFDQNLALTNGAPSKMSELLALNIFNTFYGRAGWEGVGQAKAVEFFVLVAIIALIQNKLTRSKEVQQ